MQAPEGVKQAVAVIWATIAISALGSVIASRLGEISHGELSAMLLLYAIFCILPYKIGNRSNAARYFYLVINCLSVLVLLAGAPTISQVDLISGIIQLPLVVFALYRLFEAASSDWFTSRDPARS
jgi:hypothetical protein